MLLSEQPSNTPEPTSKNANEFILQWIRECHGSPRDFVRDIEAQLGWPVRFVVIEALDALRREKNLANSERKFLNYTLSSAGVMEALSEGAKNENSHQSSLDDLFMRSQKFRKSTKFAETVDFLSKFKEYSPFNNMLVYMQNPLTTYFATASHWRKAFSRTVKDEARGMIILAPRTPVLMVYDVADTQGPALPEKLELFTRTSGRFNPAIFDHTVKNCERDQILVERKSMGQLRAGFATARLHDSNFKLRIAIREELDEASAYSVLCHELAHIYLGHLGVIPGGWWPYRLDLSHEIAEIEAEATAFIVCRRAGVETRSAEYLSSFMGEENHHSTISLDLISRVAGKIEEMGKRLLAPCKNRSADF